MITKELFIIEIPERYRNQMDTYLANRIADVFDYALEYFYDMADKQEVIDRYSSENIHDSTHANNTALAVDIAIELIETIPKFEIYFSLEYYIVETSVVFNYNYTVATIGFAMESA